MINAINDALAPLGVTVTAMAGASYSPLNDTWSLSRDLSVNYMVVGVKDD